MIVRRKTWLYRLAGQRSVQSISFKQPITVAQVRHALRRLGGLPLEIWGRSNEDLLAGRYR